MSNHQCVLRGEREPSMWGVEPVQRNAHSSLALSRADRGRFWNPGFLIVRVGFGLTSQASALDSVRAFVSSRSLCRVLWLVSVACHLNACSLNAVPMVTSMRQYETHDGRMIVNPVGFRARY